MRVSWRLDLTLHLPNSDLRFNHNLYPPNTSKCHIDSLPLIYKSLIELESVDIFTSFYGEIWRYADDIILPFIDAHPDKEEVKVAVVAGFW